LCQMIAGCSTSAAAFLTQVLPTGDDGTHFLIWFWDWLERYLHEKGMSFEQVREGKSIQEVSITTSPLHRRRSRRTLHTEIELHLHTSEHRSRHVIEHSP